MESIIAEEIKTREQKINGTKTQKGLVQKRKEVKEYEANVKHWLNMMLNLVTLLKH